MTQLNDRFLDRMEAEFGPIPRTLSYLIRPSFVAEPGNTLVWGDWSAIEARVLPWLAIERGAEKVLEVFRKNDSDPNAPDIYVVEAASIVGQPIHRLWEGVKNKDPEAKDARQTGKVAVLSLGFGGGVGALQNMAANYGLYLDDAEAQTIVTRWRENNGWARVFWDKLWKAFLTAYNNPGDIKKAGRVAYMYDDTYLNGTMFCALPNGAFLTYPSLRWTKVKREDRDGNEYETDAMTFQRQFSRKALWYGLLAENVTQATAAQILRRTLRVLDERNIVVGHTHDEVVCEVPEDQADAEKRRLNDVMVSADPWMDGLPLACETTSNWYYTKAELS